MKDGQARWWGGRCRSSFGAPATGPFTGFFGFRDLGLSVSCFSVLGFLVLGF